MDICAELGFDPERSVILRNVRSSVTLKEVRKAFAQEDKVSQIAWIGDELTGGMLCEFEEGITPVLLDNEHLNAEGDGYWKVVQIEDICKPAEKSKVQKSSDNIVDELMDHIQSMAEENRLEAAEINQLVMQRLSNSALKAAQTPSARPKQPTSTPYSRIPQAKPQVFSLSLDAEAPSPIHMDKTHTKSKMTKLPASEDEGAAKSQLTFTIPSETQKVIVEHVVKHDMRHTEYLPSRCEIRTFSGEHPKKGEVDFSTWRLYSKQLMRDTSLTDSQKRGQILNSLLPPALSIALAVGDNAPPKLYLHELEKAYGNVTGGEELYIQFLETHQQNNETSSEYLRRLHTLMQDVIERKGMAGRHFDTQLLKQFLRGCWDEVLISQLRLKEILSEPSMEIIGYSDLLFKMRAYENERLLKENRKSRCLGTTPVKARSHIQHSVDPSDVVSDQNANLSERVKQLEEEMAQARIKQSPPAKKRMQGGHQPATNDKTKERNVQAHTDPKLKTSARDGKLRGFCYKCGEDTHYLANCTNPPNAELVQQKLLQRH